MKSYRLSRVSEYDLMQIKRYGQETWGAKRTSQYMKAIENVLETLLVSPELGKSRDELIAGLRSFSVKKHIIFCRLCDEEIEVIRILHSRMNIPDYFSD